MVYVPAVRVPTLPVAEPALLKLRALLRVRPSTWLYVAVAVLASAPAWIVRYPPLEDLPFHVATLRLVHSYGDPSYGFGDNYVLNLGATQYALYYLVGSALAYLVGVANASVALTSLYLGGTVLAMRSLLLALGKDERLCLLVVPMLVNVLFLFGLMPFMCGIPVLFFSLSVAVRFLERPTRARGIALAILSFALFYTHVVPYALFGIGYAGLFPWTRPRRWLPAVLAVAPSLAAVVWWVVLSPQGKQSAGAMSGAFQHPPFLDAMTHIPQWTVDVFRDSTDEWHWIALLVVAVLAFGLSQGDKDTAKPAARTLVGIPIVCTVLYFTTGSFLGDVWLLSERFPVPGMMSLIPLMRMPKGARGALVTSVALLLAASSTLNVCRHFIRFQLEEVGDLDEAIDAMQPRRKVAALIYDKFSSVANFAPFLHFGSYYQARKGGLIQFSYASFLFWPVIFQPGHVPPPGTKPRPRWEWTPEQVPISELYPYYDYVLTRGSGFNPPAGAFRLAWHGQRWSVYERVGESSPAASPVPAGGSRGAVDAP
jgi:hypothetical protein